MPDFRQLHDIPAWWAGERPDALALVEDGQACSWAGLWQQACQAARALDQAGLRPGERLAVVGDNGIALVVLLFAASLCDAWFVPLGARLAPAEVERLLAHAGARLVAFTPSAFPEAGRHADAVHARPWPAGGPDGVRMAWPPAHAGQQAAGLAEAPAERIGALVYTTGTTGAPKGVMLRQRNLLAVAARSAQVRGLRSDDSAFGVLPVSHVYGLTSVLLATLLAGATVRLAPRFDAAAAWALLAAGQVSVLQGVPTLYASLLAHDRGLGTGRLRALFCGGAPLDPALQQAVQRRFGLPLHNGYGLTENGPSVCQTLPAAGRADGSVGPPLAGVELRVVDDGGRPLPSGEPGRLWVRGPGVMAGYFRDPVLTARVLDADGWLDTGDVVRVADDGSVYVLGRADDVIIHGGFKVHPAEVEAAIRDLPGVADVAVAGCPAQHGDQEVVAFVVWRDAGRGGADVQRLRTLLRGRLAPYKLPTRWVDMVALPLSPAGKVRRAELRQRLDGPG